MKYRAIVRYGAMHHVGNFRAEFSGLRARERCIVRTDRGVEIGTILSSVEPYEGDEAEKDMAGEVLRRVTAEDSKKLDEIHEVEEPKEFEFCKRRIQERDLPMNLASVEHLFGATKIIFYFLADGRVDFRELVKDLAQEYHTRIEMRQIGVRDEARLLADFEHCGRELCCKTFIKELQPVTMKMAKNQKATLDPSKISGRCGRLMCCLRFEDETYEDLRRKMPRKGTRVATPEGEGDVVGHEILKQEVTVELPEQRELVFRLDEIKVVRAPVKQQRRDKGGDE